MMKYIFAQLYIGIIIISFAQIAMAQLPLCRSEVGGHCVVVDTKSQSESDRKVLRGLAQTSGVPIPGLEFLKVTTESSPGEVFRQIYIFGVAITGISALVVIVASAIVYITAGDNKGRVDQARGWMKNAIFGLVLALLSWLILNTINPELTQTLNLEKLETITPSGGTPSGGTPNGILPPSDTGGPCEPGVQECKEGLGCVNNICQVPDVI